MPLKNHTVIFGGSFDPPHIGHQAICMWLLDSLNAKEVMIAPTYKHCFGKELSDWTFRVDMCSRMANFFGHSVWCTQIERQLPRPNYTYNLVNYFKSEVTNPLAVVVGGDCLSQLHTWEKWNKIPEIAKIVACGRPGYNTECKLPNVEFYPVGISTISSSEVRDRIQNGDSLDGFVSHRIKEYINDNNLYRK